MLTLARIFLVLAIVLCDDGQWPYGPLSTSGRYILNSQGEKVKWAGVNWPLNLETMLPEGIEWSSADEILDSLTDVGFNFIRMGYAAQMIDELYETSGADVSICDALIRTMGAVSGGSVCDSIIEKNNEWSKTTTRLQVWSDIISKASTRKIYVHPDLHVGKASWCCSGTDGNAWVGDTNFSGTNWTRALTYIALFAKQHSNIVSMSLRNEPRNSDLRNVDFNWATLVGNFTQAADAIHRMNSDLLITWAGVNYDSDLSALTSGSNYLNAACDGCVNTGSGSSGHASFNLGDHAWSNKLIWELHRYNIDQDCNIFEAKTYNGGFNALNIEKPQGCGSINDCVNATNIAPVIVSEFGQDEEAAISSKVGCLRSIILKDDISWAMWSLAGSYRFRSGVQNYDDSWGLKNYNWSDWRNPGQIQSFWKPFVQQTLGE